MKKVSYSKPNRRNYEKAYASMYEVDKKSKKKVYGEELKIFKDNAKFHGYKYVKGNSSQFKLVRIDKGDFTSQQKRFMTNNSNNSYALVKKDSKKL